MSLSLHFTAKRLAYKLRLTEALALKMSEINEKITELRLSAKPVFRATGYEEFPYYGTGSCFVVSRGERWYVVTARHVVNDMSSVHDMAIFPSENSQSPLPFLLGKSLRLPYTDDDACSDIVLVEIDRNAISDDELELIHVLNLDGISDQWFRMPTSLYFVVFGYPDECRDIDYENSESFAICLLYTSPSPRDS